MQNKITAAAAQQRSAANEAEYMSLAEGVGIIPEHFRNRAYEKLEFGPGEGGIGEVLAAKPAGGDQMQAFLAGIAAGADPQTFAKELLGSSSTTTRRSRTAAAA